MMSDTAKAVDAQHALTRPTKEKDMGTKVLVMREGIYNNRWGKAAEYRVGDILTTDARYAERLVEAGCVSGGVPAAVAPVTADAVAPTEGFMDVKGVSKDINTALLATGATWATIAELPIASLTKVPGLGAKTAAKLKDKAREVLSDQTVSDH